MSLKILELHDIGAFGTVCVVERSGGRRYAVKVTRPDVRDPGYVLRARDEARILARVHHPNIVRVEDLLEHEGRPVVVMEYVDGVSLREVLRVRRQGIDGLIAIEIVRQVAGALDAAFNTLDEGKPLHLVHRDVKPSNVLLSRFGEVKVVDFGHARADFDQREAETVTMVMGSIGYVAPERYDGVQDAPAGDVYALGVLLFELLTGRGLALPRTNHDEVMRRQLKHADTGMGEATNHVLHEVLASALTVEWRERPAAAVLASRLSSVLGTGRRPDLTAFAAQAVLDARARKPPKPPRQNPAWAHVAFLEGLAL